MIVKRVFALAVLSMTSINCAFAGPVETNNQIVQQVLNEEITYEEAASKFNTLLEQNEAMPLPYAENNWAICKWLSWHTENPDLIFSTPKLYSDTMKLIGKTLNTASESGSKVAGKNLDWISSRKNAHKILDTVMDNLENQDSDSYEYYSNTDYDEYED